MPKFIAKHQTSPAKFIFVSGGVISGLGKGITTASIALLLKSRGIKVTPVKIDMYLNIDAGTMNPLEHGEIFVTDDGTEADQDLGHYERFLSIPLTKQNYITAGQIYKAVLEKERALKYGGKCVEAYVHVPLEVIKRLENLAKKTDVLIVELGGTVGEYQNILFFEAARRLKIKYKEKLLFIHVGYLPIPPSIGEMKTKPLQQSIHQLNALGIQPDIIICRAEKPVDERRRKKVASAAALDKEDIFPNPDARSIYEVPLILEKQGVSKRIIAKLGLKVKGRNLKEWQNLVKTIKTVRKKVKITMVGKYYTSGEFGLEDSYVSVVEAIKHACWASGVKPKIVWMDSETVEKRGLGGLGRADGIIVPQGWGSRGVEGKIKAVRFARENKVPYLGLCFGMQMAVIEFARNVLGLRQANSTEVDPRTPYPVIHIMPEQKKYLEKHQYGGTIRLGAWPCEIKKGTRLWEAYTKKSEIRNPKSETLACASRNSKFKTPNSQQIQDIKYKIQDTKLIISERHRHRYEFNNKYRKQFEKAGMRIAGTSPDGKLVEAIELPDHPFFVGTQFHPEYKSFPLQPHPLFMEFVKSCLKK